MSKHNPEAKLQASVAQDVKIRLMEEANKKQADMLAAAKWETSVAKKDLAIQKKRHEDSVRNDSVVSHAIVRDIRQRKLEELYSRDNMQYEEELRAKGYAFRRERG